jgi:hypothetical protein
LGISLDDFLDLSPSEFSEAYESWLEVEKIRDRNEWDRARWTVFKTLCPPEKKRITIFDIESFEWDPKMAVKKAPPSTKERFEEMKKKMSLDGGKRIQTGNRNRCQRKEV